MTGEITQADLDDPAVRALAAVRCVGCLAPLCVGRYVARTRPVLGFLGRQGQHETFLFHARHAHLFVCDEIGLRDEPLCEGK